MLPPDRLRVTRELVQRAQQGDRGALADLLARYQDRVAGMVRVRLGDRLRRDHDTSDLVQEVFLAFVREVQTFEWRDDASLVTYLATLVQNRVRDAARRQEAEKRGGGRAPVSLDAGANGDRDAPEPSATETRPLDHLLREERRALVESCLAALPEPQRELILLRDYAGHAWEDIAVQTGRASADAARVAYSAAVVALSRKLRPLLAQATAVVRGPARGKAGSSGLRSGTADRSSGQP